ncbi:glycosyl hydrolase [uncultured Fibrobacter sp.]|uniref:glycosyl hydrolase n=1 Tax=uncultured Fibrobacter sp. TaxID=261512 RepID=UPI0025FD007A|nr:glycosyl hydrolase [uncultured Fibrobacter sp.]
MFIGKNIIIIGLGLAVAAFATKYEGESATVSEGAKIVNSGGDSGTGYADMQEGNISFEGVTAETAGKYQVTIHYKAPEFKANYIAVNGSTSGTVDFEEASTWKDVSTIVTLKAGTNTIALQKFWGWISVDYIDVEPYESAPFKLSAKPVTPNATESAVKLYSFLRENFGKKTISGIMTGDMQGYTMGADFKTHDDVKYIYTRTQKYPVIVGLDFLFATGPKANESWNKEYTDKAISIAKGLWKAGGIPAFTWHWKDPLDKEDAFYIQGADNGQGYTTFDFATGFKPGTTEWNTESAAYKGIVADIDHIADYFLELQKEGVAGIFRPLHEAGGKWFWWSINSGDQFAALYRLVYDRMVKVKGVKNMIWVFNPEGSTVTSWDPGSEYYDVLSIDIYNNANDHSSNASAFDKFKSASNGTKILALSENGPIPDVNNMHADEAVWSWWMPWYSTWSGTWPGQTKDAVWKSNMEDERIISLEDMPGWDKYTANISPDTTVTPPDTTVAPPDTTVTQPDTTVTSPDTTVTPPDSGKTHLATAPRLLGTATTIGIFDMNGHFMGKSVNALPQGRYVVRSKIQGSTVNTLYIKK